MLADLAGQKALYNMFTVWTMCRPDHYTIFTVMQNLLISFVNNVHTFKNVEHLLLNFFTIQLQNFCATRLLITALVLQILQNKNKTICYKCMNYAIMQKQKLYLYINTTHRYTAQNAER